jgi:hypothetical protein
MSDWILDKDCILDKFPGKGGWTYAAIPEVRPDPKAPFGWVQVNGFIDHVSINKVKLMPKGDGTLFLPVKKSWRKSLQKKYGDIVRIKLKPDNTPIKIPEEIKACLIMESEKMWNSFNSLRESTRKAYLDWIYEAKGEDTKARRILKMMNDLTYDTNTENCGLET